MKNLKNYLLLSAIVLLLASSCTKADKTPVANKITLHFNNTFKGTTIVLGDANSATATKNTSAKGQIHHFSELKYVISNIRLIKADGTEIPYNVNDLDKGATVVNQAKPATLDFVLSNIPTGTYKEIKFGLGIKSELNNLDQTKFPNFYAAAGANDTEMHWEWGTGYRFTKIEGFFATDHQQLSIHTGSTIEGDDNAPVQGTDAYRDITLNLSTQAEVGLKAPVITIKADFDHLLSGATKIEVSSTEGNYPGADPERPFRAIPVIHTARQMEVFVDNLGGKKDSKSTGMFSVEKVTN